MTEWLSEEWAQELAGTLTALPPAGDATGSVSLAVARAPRKEVHVHWSYQGGRVTEAAAGPDAGADLALTLAGPDAASVLSGEVEPSVAFMRGRLKASGEGSLLLAFLRSTTEPAFGDFLARLTAGGLVGTN